jgi:hypothetical protein
MKFLKVKDGNDQSVLIQISAITFITETSEGVFIECGSESITIPISFEKLERLLLAYSNGSIITLR